MPAVMKARASHPPRPERTPKATQPLDAYTGHGARVAVLLGDRWRGCSRSGRQRWLRRAAYFRLATIRQSEPALSLVVEAVAQTIQIPTALLTVGEHRRQSAVLHPVSQLAGGMGVITTCYPGDQLMHRVSDRFVRQPPRKACTSRLRQPPPTVCPDGSRASRAQRKGLAGAGGMPAAIAEQVLAALSALPAYAYSGHAVVPGASDQLRPRRWLQAA